MFDGKKAVIFDLDGTLIDSMWIWDQLDREIIESRGHTFPPDFYQKVAGMGISFYAYIAKKYGLPGETDEDIRNEYQKLITHKIVNVCPEKPRSWDFVRYCHSRGMKLGIA